jgi:hypothetical protein
MTGRIRALAKRTLVLLLNSPGWRTVASVVSLLVSGILTSAFVAEITTSQGLAWRTAPERVSFYLLVGFGCISFAYNRAVFRYDTRVERFLDDDYCKAYMRSQCLPEAARRYQELIRAGDVGELRRAMDEVKRILK